MRFKGLAQEPDSLHGGTRHGQKPELRTRRQEPRSS